MTAHLARANAVEKRAHLEQVNVRARPKRSHEPLAVSSAIGDEHALSQPSAGVACPPLLFRELVSDATCLPVDPYLRNYVAAMTEKAAALKNVHPPEWTQTVAPLSTPHFATPMRSLRMHLLVSAPVPFKRRNIFVDSSIGARV